MADDEKESEDTKESLQEQSENLRQQIEEGEKLQFSIDENIARLRAMPQNGPRAAVIQRTLKDFEARYDEVEKQLNELRAEFEMIETRLDNHEYVGGDAEADEEDEGGEGAFIGEGPVARSMQEHVDVYNNLGSDAAAGGGGGGGGGGAALPNFYLAAEQAEDAAPYVSSPPKKRHRTENNASAAAPAAAAAAASPEPSDPALSSAARGKGKFHVHHPFALIARRRQMTGQSAPIFQRLDPAFFVKQPGSNSASGSESDSDGGKMSGMNRRYGPSIRKMRGGTNSVYHRYTEVFVHFSPYGHPMQLQKDRPIWLTRYPEFGGTGHRGEVFAHFFKLKENAKLFVLAGPGGKYTQSVHNDLKDLVQQIETDDERKQLIWEEYADFISQGAMLRKAGGEWSQGMGYDRDLIEVLKPILVPNHYDGFVRDIGHDTTEIILFDQTILQEVEKSAGMFLPAKAHRKLLSPIEGGVAAGGGPAAEAAPVAASAQAAAGGGPAV